MKMKLLAVLVMASVATAADAESNLVISAFSGNGELSWSNFPGAIQYRVEWAPTLNGSWTNSWDALVGIPATGSTYTVQVPMFYRLVASLPDYARLLLHFDGADGDVNFPDAANGHSVTTSGDMHVSAEQTKFGSAAYFNGMGTGLRVADSPDFDPTNQAFTIDFWIYPLGSSVNTRLLVCKSNESRGYDVRLQDNAIRVVGVKSWDYNITSDACVTTGAWHHVAVSSTTNTVYLFINGALKGTCERSVIPDSDLYFCIGSGIARNYPFCGYMDEFRYSLGIARWTNNFAVPTSPYSDD